VVSVLAIGPRFVGSHLAEGDGFLRVIKICSIPSFRGELEQSYPYCKIL
jgi:hypothetical protein